LTEIALSSEAIVFGLADVVAKEEIISDYPDFSWWLII